MAKLHMPGLPKGLERNPLAIICMSHSFPMVPHGTWWKISDLQSWIIGPFRVKSEAHLAFPDFLIGWLARAIHQCFCIGVTLLLTRFPLQIHASITDVW